MMDQKFHLSRLLEASAFIPKSINPPGAWVGHIPFASWLIKEHSPKVLVELGTHTGNSYFSMCQTVSQENLFTKANNNKYIKHLIMPIRDLTSAAQSRRDVRMRAQQMDPSIQDVNGGLWETSNPEKQESELAVRFYNLILAASRHEIPRTFEFHRIFNDPEYLRGKLIPIFGRFRLRKWLFMRAFHKRSKPGLVHHFKS